MTHPPYLLKSIGIGIDIGDTGPYLLCIGSIPKYAVSHTTTSHLHNKVAKAHGACAMRALRVFCLVLCASLPRA